VQSVVPTVSLPNRSGRVVRAVRSVRVASVDSLGRDPQSIRSVEIRG